MFEIQGYQPLTFDFTSLVLLFSFNFGSEFVDLLEGMSNA